MTGTRRRPSMKEGESAPASVWVESPPHVDDMRMRHITDQHLLGSLDLPVIDGDSGGHVSLTSVASVADDTDQALREWRAYRAREQAPAPVGDIRRWAQRRRARPSAPPVERLWPNAVSAWHVLRNPEEYPTAADALLHEDVDFLDTSRGRSSVYGFHYLGWLQPLLIAYALTGRVEYAVRYGELFEQWYDLRDEVVGDWPGLDVIWYSLGVCSRSNLFNQAISLLSAEATFTDSQWRKTMKCLLGGARWAAEEHTAFRHGNWQLATVCELAHTAALYPEFGEHRDWRDVAQRRIEDHLELDFYADGGHYERAPSYHAMCLRALQVAALSADPDQWKIVDHPRLRAAHSWLADMAHPAGWVPHLQDSHITRPAELLLIGHYLYGEPAWKWLVERWMDADQITDQLDRLSARPDGSDPVDAFAGAPSAEPSGSSELLRSSGYAVLRQGWTVDDLTTTFNVGPYVGHELEPHSHHASLDFVISGWGEALAWEAGGPPSYDDPGYYSWYQAGRGHNSVQLDGEQDSANRNTVVESFWTLRSVANEGDSPTSDRGLDIITGRHDAFAQRHTRRMIFVRSEPCYWLVADELGAEEPVSSTWTIHGRSAWRAESERRFVSPAAPGLVVVPAESPSDVEVDAGPARIPLSQLAPSADVDAGELRDRRLRPDEYGVIHGLHLTREVASNQTVLVPYQTQPPAVAVDLPVDGPLSVRLAGVHDTFGPNWWSRRYSNGDTEAARWDIDPEATAELIMAEPVSLNDQGSPMINVTGCGLTAWWCRRNRSGLTAMLVTDRRTDVAIDPATGLTGRARINGVGVTAHGDVVRRMTLPSEGTWTVHITRAGADG